MRNKSLKISIAVKKLLYVFAAMIAAFATGTAHASAVTYNFSGVTYSMGAIAAGTAFTGTFSWDPAAAGVTTSYHNGTQTLFSNAYSALTMTIGGQTVTEGAPGTMALYNNLNVNPAVSIPNGDSLYTFNPLNGQGPLASSGSFTGLTPNYLYLGFVDGSGKVFSGTSLPSSLSLSSFGVLSLPSFGVAFIGIDYGPMGAGNTNSIALLTSLTPVAAVPEPGEWALMLGGLGLMGFIAVRRKQA